MTGLFGCRRTGADPAAFQQQVLQLRRRQEESGLTRAVVDESWRQMRFCFDEVQRGNGAFAGLLFGTARTSFVMHAKTEQWFFAVASALAFGTAVSSIDADRAARGLPFPAELRPGVQAMVDMSVALAHRAGVPLAGCIIAESLTTMRLGDRTHRRELSAILEGEDARRRLRALRDIQRRQLARAASLTAPEAADSVAALRTQADTMLLQDLEAALADGTGRYVLAGPTVVPAALAACTTGRSVVFVAPGADQGAAFRLEPPIGGGTDRALCESVALPGLGLDAVQDQVRRVREALRPAERRVRVRDRAAEAALKAAADAVWEPVLTAWPDLRGGRVALVPLGASATLPYFAAPVDGVPAGAAMDLTIIPSGKSLMFASAWPRPSRREVLVAADPWYRDGAGGVPIPFTVDEARAVASVHSVAPVILRDSRPDSVPGTRGQGADGDSAPNDRLRALTGTPSLRGAPPVRPPAGLVDRIAAAHLVHLASHGVLDAQDPLRSSLLLGQAIPLGALLEEDLQRGATVVLSACHLAGIGTAQSSEQLGFPAAILAMGAGSVIAALWPVPDSEETVRLMTHLHEELRALCSPSVALGRAVARAAAEGLRPTVWSSFTHFGA